jgi:phospholipid N-methyltransferase
MPSSRFLIERLLRPIDFDTARSIVQLGVGTACITRGLLERMDPTCALTCVEVDGSFIEECAGIGDPRLTVHHACATSLREILNTAGVPPVDHIVSALPLTILDDGLVDKILDTAQACLSPGGKFLQYQYSPTYLRRLSARYADVRLGFTLRNVPPAFVYECVNQGMPATA